MPTRVKLLLAMLFALIMLVPLAIAQEETPTLSPFALTATAIIEQRTSTTVPSTEEATAEPTEEATIDAVEAPIVDATLELTEEATPEPTEEATAEAEVVEPTEEATPELEPSDEEVVEEVATLEGLPLLCLLVGAVGILMIGTVVLIQERPRPTEEDEEEPF